MQEMQDRFEKNYCEKHGREKYLKRILTIYKSILLSIPICAIFFPLFLALGILTVSPIINGSGDNFQILACILYFLLSGISQLLTVVSLIRLPVYKQKAEAAKRELTRQNNEQKN